MPSCRLRQESEPNRKRAQFEHGQAFSRSEACGPARAW
ncbi:unnamed protein product [Ixodes pacificus]